MDPNPRDLHHRTHVRQKYTTTHTRKLTHTHPHTRGVTQANLRAFLDPTHMRVPSTPLNRPREARSAPCGQAKRSPRPAEAEPGVRGYQARASSSASMSSVTE